MATNQVLILLVFSVSLAAVSWFDSSMTASAKLLLPSCACAALAVWLLMNPPEGSSTGDGASAAARMLSQGMDVAEALAE